MFFLSKQFDDGHKLTDFFLASSINDLNGLNEAPPATTQGGAVLDSDVDLLMLCNLESILTGAEWESVFDKVYINPARDHGPDGPWIYKVSNCLLDALDKLTPDALADCASQWAESDEWTLREDSAPEKIVEVLRQLIGLARLAGSQGKSLFISTDPCQP